MSEPAWNFEQEPTDERLDETGVNLRAYFDQMPDGKMRQYRREWSDDELMAWDGNFRSDGELLIPCCESSDVDVGRYRRVLEEAIAYRDRVRGA